VGAAGWLAGRDRWRRGNFFLYILTLLKLIFYK